jgi:hypothetical protein
MTASPQEPQRTLQLVLSAILCNDASSVPFATKLLQLNVGEVLKIGRKVSAKVPPAPDNLIFDSKVLSRNHAELWSEIVDGVLVAMIKDSGSSNGTFVNGLRLSPEGEVSQGRILHSGDELDFGVDIMDEGKLLFSRISCKVSLGTDAEEAWRERALLNKDTLDQNALDHVNRQIAMATRTQIQLQRLHEVPSSQNDVTS